MQLTIRELIGFEDAITMEDGQKVYDVIHPELAAGKPVVLDFAGIEAFASPFFNTAIGQLLRDLERNELNRLLRVENIRPAGDQTMRQVIKNVLDFGLGIPSNVREFKRLPQLGAAAAMRWAFQEGTTIKPTGVNRGMGLYLLKQFIRLNHGRLEVFSLWPEQALGKASEIGPATDVYALGAILYELLTGRPPFRATTTLDTLRQVVAEEPVPPSQLNALTPRDLETISLKCLHKEPGKRYSSAEALAEDLERYLADKPILARPVGRAERSWRWCRRNPAVASLLATVFFVLLAGAATALFFAVRAHNHARGALQNAELAERNAEEATEKKREAEDQGERADKKKAEAIAQARRVEQVARFMQELFNSSDPRGLSGAGLFTVGEQGRNLTAGQLLQAGARRIKTRLQGDPVTQAALMDTIGDVSRTLNLFDEAKPLLEEALALRQKHLGDDHPDVATSLLHLGNWHCEKGEFEKSESYYRRALEIHRENETGDSLEAAEVHARLAVLIATIGDEAGEPFANSLAGSRRRT